MSSRAIPGALAVALLCSTGGFTLAGGGVITVDPGSAACDDAAGALFCSLQPALDAAQPGGVVAIAAGTYDLWEETLRVGKDLILRGAGIGRTVLDGGGGHSGPVIEIGEDAEEVNIQGLSIINRIHHGGNRKRAAGIDHLGAGLILERVEIRDTQGGWGGALSSGVPLAEVVLRQVRFTGNSGFTGAAVDFRNAPGASLAVHDSVFSGNSAIFTGGGLFIRDVGEVLLSGVRLEKNESGNRGGALFVAMDAENGTLRIVDSVVQGNWSKGTGGIAASGATLSIILEAVILTDNTSANEPAHSDCSSEHEGVFRSAGGNRIGRAQGCPMREEE